MMAFMLRDINGVVLFIPTVSTVVYNQQIRRALSASQSNQPIIYNAVNNFGELYATGMNR